MTTHPPQGTTMPPAEEAAPDGDPLRPVALAVGVAMAVAALANVADHRVVESQASTSYEAIAVKEGHDLLSLAENHFSSTQDRFLLLTQLRVLAPGSTVTLPTTAGRANDLNDEGVRSLGGGAGLTRADYDPTVPPGVAAALSQLAVATGEDDTLGPYALVLEDRGEAADLVVVQGPERAYVAPRSVLEDLGVGGLP